MKTGPGKPESRFRQQRCLPRESGDQMQIREGRGLSSGEGLGRALPKDPGAWPRAGAQAGGQAVTGIHEETGKRVPR